MIDGIHTKEMELLIDKIRMPSGHCQACLSDKSPDKDFMITCTLCQSSIHNKHYGREIDEAAGLVSYDKWKCERCRMLVELQAQKKLGQAAKMQCHFCPSPRGILKRVIYNNSETIWLHPQCSTWSFPIIYQKNNRRIHYNCQYPTRPTGKFWVNLQDQNRSQCQVCGTKEGYKIKCMYYQCQKYYHCSCAKSIGFIRDLQSMRFENLETYIPPYCQQHLEQRIVDCLAKTRKYQNLGDEGKASGFTQMMAAYQTQLKNMTKSADKYRSEEQMRKQMHYQTGNKQQLVQELSFESPEESFRSKHDPEFLEFVFDRDYPCSIGQSSARGGFIFARQSRIELEEAKANIELRQKMERKIKEGEQRNSGVYNDGGRIGGAQQSEPEDSEWSSGYYEGRLSDQ